MTDRIGELHTSLAHEKALRLKAEGRLADAVRQIADVKAENVRLRQKIAERFDGRPGLYWPVEAS